MARRKMDTASTTSLISSDLIPKEYHRKVLKKIAQLTKVIYVLNTKNDEHESMVSRLKATHKEEIERILADSFQKLTDYKGKLRVENDAMALKVTAMSEQLTLCQNEKDCLLKNQESYEKTMEERLAECNSQYSNQITSITKEMMVLQEEQRDQLKQVEQLQAKWSVQLEQKMKGAKHDHEMDVCRVTELLKLQQEEEIDRIKDKHQRELGMVKSELEAALKNQQNQLSSTHQLQLEEKIREMQVNLCKQHAEQEDILSNQISTLTHDLRNAQDNLALSQKKIAELLVQLEHSETERTDAQVVMKGNSSHVVELESQLRQLKNDLEISHDLYEKQRLEMDKMASTIGQCHAQQVIDEGTIQKLKILISKFETTIKELNNENKILQSSQLSTSEQLSAKILSLEKEVEGHRQEKKELKLQYAREIEAAQAHLGDRESQLILDHTEAIQNLRKENQHTLEEVKARHKEALEDLERTKMDEKERSLLALEEKWKHENDHLSTSLVDRLVELNLLREQRNELKADLSKREKGFGSVSDSLNHIKEELACTKRELASTEQERKHLRKDNVRLTTDLESLEGKRVKEAKAHQDQMNELQRSLTEELEEKWKSKLKKECGLLMKELSSRHKEDSRAALIELASHKDKAMELAAEEWKKEKGQLLERIANLQELLEKGKESNSIAIDEVKEKAENRLNDIRLELNRISKLNADTVHQLNQSHAREIVSLQRKLDNQRETALARLECKHKAEMQEQLQAGQIAVKGLEDKMSRKSEEALQESQQRFLMEMTLLRKQYLSEKDESLMKLSQEHKEEAERMQQAAAKNAMVLQAKISKCEAVITTLSSEKEMQGKELSKLHDRMSMLNVNANKMQKQLDFKNQEIVRLERESNARLQQLKKDLRAEYEAEQESLKTQYLGMRKTLYEDFKAATALLTSKIKQLEKEIQDWEMKYASRDSKPEDLAQIKELKETTQHQRAKIKDLVAEKRLYQLELANREKNYNQLFNVTPSVGILDPLAHKQKKPTSCQLRTKFQSAPSLITNSDVHTQHQQQAAPPPLLSNHSLPELHSSPHQQHLTTAAASGSEVKHQYIKRDSPLTQHRMSASLTFNGSSKGRDKRIRNGGTSTATTSLPLLHSVSLAGP